MTKQVMTVVQAVVLDMLTVDEAHYITKLAARYDLSGPPLNYLNITLLEALDWCRQEYTVMRATYPTENIGGLICVVNLTMKIIQAMAMIPVAFRTNNRVVEHMIHNPGTDERAFIVVPWNCSDAEIQIMVESEQWVVAEREVKYPVRVPE